MKNQHLQKAIDLVGSEAKLGTLLGVSQPSVNGWKARKVPAHRAVQIEQVTNGRIKRHDLRPDLFLVIQAESKI